MNLDSLPSARRPNEAPSAGVRPSGRPVQPASGRPETQEEAAKQFEEILARQFVRTMTDQLFKTQLSGEESAGWMKSQGDAQRDVLTDVLTRHLVESGTLGLSDLLLRQWKPQDDGASEAAKPRSEKAGRPGEHPDGKGAGRSPLTLPDSL